MAIRLRPQYQQQKQASGGGFNLLDSVGAYAQQREGYSPHAVMQEGTVTYQNGVPGVMVKYNTPQGSSTEWTPLQNWDGSPIPVGDIGRGGGGGTGGGGGGMLTSSPYYQQVLAATNSAAAADAAARRGAIQQALIGWGLVPEGFQDKYGDVDDLTRQLAGKNTASGISTHARMLQARADAIRQFSRGLSARGLRRSGAKGYGLRRRQLQFDQNYADALQKLLGYTGGLYSQFAGNEYQRQLQLANALAYASQNLGDYGGGGGGGGSSTPYSPDYSLGNYVSPTSLNSPQPWSSSGTQSSLGGSLSRWL